MWKASGQADSVNESYVYVPGGRIVKEQSGVHFSIFQPGGQDPGC